MKQSEVKQAAPPREFWIVRHFASPGVIKLLTHETKPEWKSLQLGDERIHVIEAAPTLALIEKLEEALNSIMGDAEDHDNYRDISSTAFKALNELAQWRSQMNGEKK